MTSYYVAPDGSQDADGSTQNPFATLKQARDTIRRMEKRPNGGITVFLRGGLYTVSETFSLDIQDSGTESCPIAYKSYPGETARLYAGTELPASAFGPVTDPDALERIPAKALPHIVQADLRALGIENYGELSPTGYSYSKAPRRIQLYADGKLQTVARYPNGYDELTVGELLNAGRSFYKTGDTHIPDAADPAERGGGRFRYLNDEISAERAAAWDLEKETAYLMGGWRVAWAPDSLAMREITYGSETGGGEIELAHTTTYGIRAGTKFYAHNLLCELDAPGEYYIDRERGLLFYYPVGDMADITLEMATMDAPIIQADQIKHYTFSGLHLEMGRGDGIEINRGEYVTVENCTIRNMERNAITLGKQGEGKGGGYHNRINGNLIYNIGEHGVYAESAPNDRRNLIMADCEITNNTIHAFGQIIRIYRNAVQVTGCGYRIAHNLMYDAPTHAIEYRGNDILIEYNEIYDVMQEQDDGGTIYAYGDYTFVNCVIRYNYIHSLKSRAEKHVGISAIYADYCVGDMEIYGNVITDVDGNGIFANGGQRIIIYHNIMANITERSILNGAYGAYFWLPLENITPGRSDEYSNIWFDSRRQLIANMHPDEEPWVSTYPWVKDIFNTKWEPDPLPIPVGTFDHPEEIAQMPGESWDPERGYLSREPYDYFLPIGCKTYENYIINGNNVNRYIAFWVERPNSETWNDEADYWKFNGHFYDFGAIYDNHILRMDEAELKANFRDPENGDYTLLDGAPLLTAIPGFSRLDLRDAGPIK